MDDFDPTAAVDGDVTPDVQPPPETDSKTVRTGRQRGRGASGQNAGGRRATSAGSRSSKTKDDKCLVPYCTEKCCNQKVWCQGHACSWTGFCLQAQDQGPEAIAKMEALKAKGMEKEKGEAVGAYALKNPPDKKYAKKQLFDVLGYFKQRFATTSTAEKDDEKPMTREAFNCHCKNVLGLTGPETDSWWQELEDDPTVQRDHRGFRNRFQLWIPLGESRERKREKGVTDAVTEESQKMKKYKEHDVQVLCDHVLRQKTSMADSFLTSELPEESRRLLKRKAEPDIDTDGPAPEQRQRKRSKTFNGDKDGPRYHNTMEGDLEKLIGKIKGVDLQFEKARDELCKIPEHVKQSDLALQGYIRKLQWRYQLFLKWQGMDSVAKLHNCHLPEGSSGSQAGQPSAFPVCSVVAEGDSAVPLVPL